MSVQALAFLSGDERYLVRLEAVRAVVRLRGLRRLPGTGGGLAGVLDVQDTPVAIYDTRTERGSEGGDVMVLAAGWPHDAIGIACDRVDGLVELAPEEEAADGAPGRLRPPGLPAYVETMLRVDGTLLPLVDIVGLAQAQA